MTRPLQTRYSDDLWKICVVTMLLVNTRGEHVRPVLEPLFVQYPAPKDMAESLEWELERVLRPVGLAPKRAYALRRFSRQYLSKSHEYPRGTQDRWLHECYGMTPAVIEESLRHWKPDKKL